MSKLDARKSGSFKVGGEIEIHRLGFGAMRITGKGIWGPPEDKPEAIRTLKRLPDLGIDFVDTADSYGPDVSEQLIREALHPYRGMLIATKAGFQRPGPSVWEMDGRPEWLRKQALKSCKQLGVERIGLWQLHRIDPKVPRNEQFGAVKSLLDDGIICHAGLSNVSVADIEAASKVFRWRRCRTATTSSIAAARMCWIIARRTASASFPSFRLPPATSPSPARSSMASPRPMMQHRARSRLPGC
jgi:aryl-alcohol dehydrogenase-like predicted oxidoreductase